MKVNVSKKQWGVIIAIIILAILLISGGIACVVTDSSPADLVNNIVYSNEKDIVGKWQIEDKEDLFAYEFFDDGTYKNYLAGFYFNGKYEVNGNKLILMNPKLSKQIVFKVKIDKDEMTLTKKEEDGEKTDKTITKYRRVDHINLKTFNELLNDIKNQKTDSDSNQ